MDVGDREATKAFIGDASSEFMRITDRLMAMTGPDDPTVSRFQSEARSLALQIVEAEGALRVTALPW
jgi:hypothetical protein